MFYLLLAILIMSIVSIHLRMLLGIYFPRDRIILFFLLCIVFQVFIYAVKEIYPSCILEYLSNIPMLMYGPILFYVFLGLNKRETKFVSILKVSTYLLFPLYTLFAILSSLKFISEPYQFVCMYGLLIFSLLTYPLYVIFQNPHDPDLFEKDNLLVSFSFILVFLSTYLVLLLHAIIKESILFDNSNIPVFILSNLLVFTIFIYLILLAELKKKLACNKKEPVVDRPVEGKTNLTGSYRKSKIEAAFLKKHKEQIDKYMLEKPFLRPQYCLDDFSSDLKIYKHHCSQILNRVYGQNFPQFINSSRIEYACSLLKREEMTMGMEELAEHCGFNSKASFYRNFSLIMGCTPLQYRQQHMK